MKARWKPKKKEKLSQLWCEEVTKSSCLPKFNKPIEVWLLFFFPFSSPKFSLLGEEI
jgi:hypothetical protein